MAWMTVEAAVGIAAGIVASSIALIAFGLDSVVEFAAGAIVIWQLRGGSGQREHRAVRLIGLTFFLLAAYLVIETIRDLISQARPEAATAGLIVTAVALLVMPLLAAGEATDRAGPGQPDPHYRRGRKQVVRLDLWCRLARRRAERLAGLVVG